MARRKERVLITGGAGFIGSHLCDHFLSRGFEVLCVDNLLTGSTDNIAHIRSRAFTYINVDVTNYIYIEGPIDYILHFASPASPKDYLELPIQTLKVGSLGTHKALGLAKAKKATFLLASTSEVYGDPLEHPQKETYWGNVNPIGPRGVYDEAKRFAEALTVAYRTALGVDTKIVRIFNTYGPRMRLADGRAIPNFMWQAILGKPVTVFGDGRQTRSFCYVDDLVEGIFRLVMSRHAGPMNLGNPQELSLLDMAQRIIRLTGSKSRIVHRPLPTDDPKVRQPDIRLATKALRWGPKVGLDAGLRHTIAYFRPRVRRRAGR
jgi:dTDP-glucose 4,6-dehydratase